MEQYIFYVRLIKLKESLSIVMITIRKAPSNLSPDECTIENLGQNKILTRRKDV